MDEAWKFVVEHLFSWDALSGLVAFIALVRPELTAIFRRRDFRLIPSHRLELGFADLGPTIGVFCTFFCASHDALVRSVSLNVKRKRDSASHLFRWAVFKANQFNAAPGKDTPNVVELASPFFMARNSTKTIQIVFADDETKKSFEPPVMEVRKHFLQFLEKRSLSLSSVQPDQLAKLANEDFRTSDPIVVTTYSELQRHNYWETGEYELNLNVEVEISGTIQTTTNRLSFALDREMTASVGLNVVALIQNACFLPVIYNFAYPISVVRSGQSN